MNQIKITLSKRKSQLVSIVMFLIFSSLFISAIHDLYTSLQFCNTNPDMSSQKELCSEIMLHADAYPLIVSLSGIGFALYFFKQFSKQQNLRGDKQ